MVIEMSGRQRKVFDRLSVKIVAVTAAGLMSVVAWAQAPAAPAYKDGEAPVVTAIQGEKDPAKKLELLKGWEQKFPDSDFKGMRAIMIIQTEAPIAMAGLQPNASAPAAAAAEKAAKDLADNIDSYFSPANKQPATTADQWDQAKKGVNLQAHTVLATIAFNKKTPEGDATAEAEYKKLIELAPEASGGTSYQLGSLILREKKVDRIPEALYYIARGIDATGAGALPPANKKAAEDYLKRAYDGYHGSADGLEDLKKAANAAPMPPAGFHIKSVTEIDKEKQGDEAAFASAHPDIALWRTVRTALTAADGDTYFQGSVKDAGLPPGGDAFKMFTGKIVEVKTGNKELLVNVDSPVGDAVLQFEEPLKGTIDPGTEIKFKGSVDAYTKEPYTLTFKDLGKEDVEGLPAAAFAATPARKPRPPAKKK
jgi:hypothetical protein